MGQVVRAKMPVCYSQTGIFGIVVFLNYENCQWHNIK